MIHYACPKCREPLHAPDNQLGSIHACPRCQAQVQVPLVPQQMSLGKLVSQPMSSGKIVVLSVGIVGVVVGALLLCGVVGLVAIQMFGKNVNTTFTNVGSSIAGST